MPVTLEYYHKFIGMSPDDVFEKIYSWLNREGAKKIIGNRPSGLEAAHGSMKTLFAWQRNGKKKLVFSISPLINDVEVRVIATPSLIVADDIARMYEDAKINWGLLMEECWAYIEGAAMTESGKIMTEAKQELVNDNKVNGRKMFRYGSLGLILFLAIGLSVAFITKNQWVGPIIMVPSVFLGLTAFWGFMKMRSK